MEVGSKALMSCPASMAYGNVMKRNIPENSDLEFDVELLACEKDEMSGMDMSQIKAMAAMAEQDNSAQE